MEEKDVEGAKEAMRRFDPQLVAIAMQDIDIKVESVDSAKEAIGKVYESIDAELPQEKMKVFSKAVSEVEKDVVSMEVENIRSALADFDRGVLIEAGKDLGVVVDWLCIDCIPCRGGCIQLMVDRGAYCFDDIHCKSGCIQLMHVAGTKYCIEPIGDCGPCIQTMNVLDRIEPSGVVVTDGRYSGVVISNGRVVSTIPVDSKVGGVVITDGYFGNVGLCLEYSVNCTGPQVYVMSKCRASLFSLDVGATISPVDAVLQVAESHPALHKRITRMVGKMKEANEL